MPLLPHVVLQTSAQQAFAAIDRWADRVRFMLPCPQGWQAVTWRQMGERARALGACLMAEGVGPDVKVAILGHNCLDWGYAGLAIIASGGALVPVYPSSTPDQAHYVVDHSDSVIVFVDRFCLPKLLSRWHDLPQVKRVIVLESSARDLPGLVQATGLAYQEVRPRLISMEEALAWGQSQEKHDPGGLQRRLEEASMDQTATIVYTSGTTGAPKGVVLSHRNLAVNGSDWVEVNGPLVPPRSIDLFWLPLSHIFGWGEFCLGNHLGFTSYITDHTRVLDLLPTVRPTVFMSVPAYWEKLYQRAQTAADPVARLKEITGGELSFCLSGGAGLKEQVKEFFLEAGLFIVEGYGLTETSPTLTMNRRHDFHFASVGKPFPSVELRLDGDGEILAKGPNVFQGYYKDPEGTARVFTDDGWIRTGDVGAYVGDGFLRIIDRKKDILVTAGGKNVAPQNIENLFIGDPLIERVVVYGDQHKYLVALITLQPLALKALGLTLEQGAGHPDVLARVQSSVDQANAALASFETIKRLHITSRAFTVEEGLLTPSLKVKRKRVYEEFREELEGLYGA